MTNVPESVSTIEAIWTLLMLIGLANDARLAHLAHGDYEHLRARGTNGLARIVALKNRRGAVSRAVVWVSFATAGIAAMFFSPGTPQRTTFPVTLICLFLAVIVLLITALLDSRSRQAVTDYADRMEANTTALEANTLAVEADTQQRKADGES